jgi:CBS domain-containing protein
MDFGCGFVIHNSYYVLGLTLGCARRGWFGVSMSLKLEDVMVKDLIGVEVNVSVRKALELMNRHEIGCLVVMRRGKLAGIVTERDMVKRVLLDFKDPEKIRVSEIMSKPVVVGAPQMGIEDAVKLMFKRNIKKLPVADNDQLIGLVTLTDLVLSLVTLTGLDRPVAGAPP